MDVSSVNSNPYPTSTPTQTQRNEQREPVQAKPPEEKPQSQQANEEKRPAPVVNAQGQTTGRIVNTSA